jgi:hypothetical protein
MPTLDIAERLIGEAPADAAIDSKSQRNPSVRSGVFPSILIDREWYRVNATDPLNETVAALRTAVSARGLELSRELHVPKGLERVRRWIDGEATASFSVELARYEAERSQIEAGVASEPTEFGKRLRSAEFARLPRPLPPPRIPLTLTAASELGLVIGRDFGLNSDRIITAMLLLGMILPIRTAGRSQFVLSGVWLARVIGLIVSNESMGGVPLSDEQNGLVERRALWLHLFWGGVASAPSSAADTKRVVTGTPSEREASDALCSIGILELINPTDATERHRYHIISRVAKPVRWLPHNRLPDIAVVNPLTGKAEAQPPLI